MNGSSLYAIGGLLGYFAIMIAAIVLGAIISNKKISWIIFAVGSGLTLFSLIGNQRTATAMGISDALTPRWIVFFILLIGGAALVGLVRRRK